MPLRDLPSEILENVLLHVNTSRDLLNLALTSKFFCEIIIPNHLNFIDIASDVSAGNTTIWRTLATYPILAKRTSRLYVIADGPGLISTPCLRYVQDNMHGRRYVDVVDQRLSTEEDPYALFQTAILSMINLRYFVLLHPMSAGDIYKTLSVISNPCRQLQSLHLDITHVTVTKEMPSNALSFPSLTSFTFFPCNLPCTICGTLCDQILFGSSSLVNICIVANDVFSFDSPRFLTMGNWPKLRRLSLEGSFSLYPSNSLDDNSKIEIATSFFERHPLLETLSVDDMYSSLPIKVEAFSQRSAFPSLRSVRFSWTQPAAFMDQLYHISGLQQFPTSSFDQLLSLRSCTIKTGSIDIVSLLLNAVPQLERLDLTYFGSPQVVCLRGTLRQYHAFPNNRCSCHEEAARTAISHFSNLTHVFLTPPQCFGITRLYHFKGILIHLPKLQYLRLSDDLYVIERNRDNSTTYRPVKTESPRRLTLDGEAHSLTNWGDFYPAYKRWRL